MNSGSFEILRRDRKPLIAALHLPPLPGSPGWCRAGRPPLSAAVEDALARAEAFLDAGFDALILENFGDAPFYPQRCPPETVAAMAVVAAELCRAQPRAVLGLNVLRNDGAAALALAVCVGASFIRVNILNGVSAADQGLICGQAHAILRERERLGAGPKGANPVAIFADVHVKHARSLGEPSLGLAACDLAERGGADAVIVSGPRTAQAPELERLREARLALAGRAPLLVGSGLSPASAPAIAGLVDGAIAASAALIDGIPGRPVDPERARALVEAFKSPPGSASDQA